MAQAAIRSFPRVFNLTNGRGSPDFRAFYNAVKPKEGGLLALDIGTKHVGMAVSDAGKMVAFRASSYRRGTLDEDRRTVHTQVSGMKAVGIIVGIPCYEGPNSGLDKFITMYTMMLLRDVECSVCAFWDERYSTVMAYGKMLEAAKLSARRDFRRKKQMLDEGAAAEILQEVLEAIKVESEARK